MHWKELSGSFHCQLVHPIKLGLFPRNHQLWQWDLSTQPRKVQALNGRWFLTVNQSKLSKNVSFKVKLLLQFLLKVKIKKIFAITWGSLEVEGTAKISYTHMDSDKQKKRQCCDLNWYHILHLKACGVYDVDDNALGLIIFSRVPMWEPSDRQWRKPSYL